MSTTFDSFYTVLIWNAGCINALSVVAVYIDKWMRMQKYDYEIKLLSV